MEIIDLADDHQDLFSLCLEDWSDEAKEGGPRRRAWVERFREKGLKAKLALDDRGVVGGMIQSLPIEASFVDGAGLDMILCVWVHGHKQGRGNFQGHGLGAALLEALERDARERGRAGMAAWGLWLPFWMKAAWFKKRGYRSADRNGLASLVWKPFRAEARAPRWLKATQKVSPGKPGRVTVTAYVNGWCLAQNMVAERARRAAAEFGDRADYVEIDTSDRSVVLAGAPPDALFIDGKQVSFGPPPSYKKIRSLIERKVRRLK